MNIKQVNPYIHFNGNAAEAISFYESALNGKAEGVMKYGDAPGMKIPDEHKGLVMHSMLQLTGGIVMISDEMPGSPVKTGGNIQIVLDFGDVNDIAKAFQAMSEGGKVLQPLEDTFWGAKFGMLEDKFGVRWMMNCQLSAPAQA